MRPTRTLPVLLAAVLTLGACGGGDGDTSAPAADRESTATTTADGATGADSSKGTTVTIKVFNFQPDPLEISAGDTVTWSNGDEILHTVTSGTREKPDGTFDGQLPEKGATFDFTFDEAGTYEYFCSRHPGEGMTASVVVT